MKSLHRRCAAASVVVAAIFTVTSIAAAAPQGVPPPPIEPETTPAVVGWTPPDLSQQRRLSGGGRAGLAIFVGAYGLTFVSGLFGVIIGDNLGCNHCTEVGASYLLPAFGPFLALKWAESDEGRATSVIFGSVQLVGLTVLAIGSIAGRSRRNSAISYRLGPNNVVLSIAF